MSKDMTTLALLSAGCVLATGGVAAIVLHVVRRRPLALSLLIVSLTPVVGVAVAVLVSVRAMFISHHDSKVTLITVVCSAVLAGLMSVWLGHRVAVESRALGAQVRDLGDVYDGPSHSGTTLPTAARPLSGWARSGSAPAELGELAQQLATARARLEDAHQRETSLEASRRELVAFMSHDLRTPLAGLRALAEGLEDGVIADPAAALTRMRQTVERMTGLVDDLFELSRLTSGAPSRRLMSVSMSELADDVAELLDDHARSRQVEIVVEAPAQDRLRVLGDSDELSRALTNLLANAVRHTPENGRVRLVADRAPDGRVRVAVADGCGGIAEQDLPKLFEVGWRGAADRTPDDGGAGLGLAIARGVVEAHDGTLGVANIPGGCRFELALPGRSGTIPA
jgi:signal transduction histidine kinase